MTVSGPFRQVEHEVDLCVVGGGMAGLVSAIAAARHGARVALMHERPVLGGNASSECRMHVCGADRHNGIRNLRETGILEELRLENLRRNAVGSYSIWDTVLYEKARFQEGLTLLLNCTCQQAQMDGDSIRSVTGWQLTTQTYHTVRAKIFADCSGDGILAPLTGAACRVGREASSEFGESIAPPQADKRTMGMTCLFGARPHDTAQPFEPLAWANRYDDCTQLPYGLKGHRWIEMGYWWVELGGQYDSIGDTEMLRDELLKIVYGVWDHIKNRCPEKDRAANWALDWIQFLPAKRESRRYVGDHVLCQGDIDSQGKFDDLVAYGGWSMDDHHPAGFAAAAIPAPATVFHPAPSPYGIAYRTLYSRNIRNLMFAGRNASCTHAAMSSTRVMGTGCSQGQALGTAAAMAVRLGAAPREVGSHMKELQQTLLRDDAYLPWIAQEFGPLTMQSQLSASQGDAAVLRDGTHRPVGDQTHAWEHQVGDWAEYRFAQPQRLTRATLILDSAMDKLIALSRHQKDNQLRSLPGVLQRAFRIEGLSGGKWSTLASVTDNHQRLVRLDVGATVDAVRYVLDGTWGQQPSRLYAFYLE